MQISYLVASLGWIAYQTTAQPKWTLEFENSTYTGSGEAPEIWIKVYDPRKAGIITGKILKCSSTKIELSASM